MRSVLLTPGIPAALLVDDERGSDQVQTQTGMLRARGAVDSQLTRSTASTGISGRSTTASPLRWIAVTAVGVAVGGGVYWPLG